MKNKLGIISLIVSSTPWLFVFFYTGIWRSIKFREGDFLVSGAVFGLFYTVLFFWVVIGIITAIWTLTRRREFKGYPILAIVVIMIQILFFILWDIDLI